MKKLLLILALVFASQGAVKASHVLGGEIRWECLGNGNFVFFAKLFRDCTGITYPFTTQTLQIVGNPLPRSAGNSTISSIQLKPDSNTWINNRFGDTSPTCKPGGQTISCGNADEGAIQQFFWQSDPIQLNGTPPAGGWKFYMTPPCCRPNVTNLASGGSMMLRAIMYSDKQNNNTNPCKDSSPEFLALPTNMLCRGYEFTYNHTAIDKDLDSLVYSWDRTYNSPPNAPQPVPYASGYSWTNPTPDQSFNPQNIPATLDPITGQIRMGVWSGSPLTLDYLTVVRVDAYREGRVIASIFREIPFVFFDCPRLVNQQINRPPEIFIDGIPADAVVEEITAGQPVRVPFQAQDLDISPGIPGLQKVTVEPAGFMFSRNLQTVDFCYYNAPPGEDERCAYLQNQNPVFNGIAEPPRYELSGYAGLATEFVWDTRCHHIATVGTGVPGQNVGIYNFVMRTYDDHCPIPGINYPTITIRVKDPIPLLQPIMKGVSVNLDGSISYQWVPPMDSANSFVKYRVEFITPNDGFPPNPALYQFLDTNERRYQQERIATIPSVYIPQPGNPNFSDIFRPVQNKDFYIRMQSISGCTKDVPSIWSQPARVMELTATPNGAAPQPVRSRARLSWNRAKPTNSFNHPYFQYVSPTRYYVYTNDSITYGPGTGNYSGHDNPDKWLLRGSTYTTNLDVTTTTCSGFIAFRVEARDTIITFKKGTAPRQDTLDTLTFSTFSTLDTLLMVNPGFIPNPKFDTLEVLANGDLYMKVDAGGAGTTGEFRFFDGTVAPANRLGSIIKPTYELTLTNQNYQLNPANIVIQGLDECDSNTRANSAVYQTFIPTGAFPADPCAGVYDLSWIKPTGFPNGVRGYKIYRRDRDAGAPLYSNWELVQTITNANTLTASLPIRANADFIYKVVAYDQEQAVIISAEHQVSVGNIRTYEVVAAPELRCSYVYDDGTVGLSFLPSTPARGFDTTGNWVSYKFQYRQTGGNWVDLPNSVTLPQDTDSLFVGGIDAIANAYQFRATTLSGCSGAEEAPYATIDLIQPTATAIVGNANKDVLITWTGTGVASNTREFVGKGFGLTNYYNPAVIGTVDDIDPNQFTDNGNIDSCSTIGNYWVSKADELMGCVSRSRPDTAMIIDQIPPDPQDLNYASYKLNKPSGFPPTNIGGTNFNSVLPDGDIEIGWTIRPSDDIDSLLFFTPDQATGQNDELTQVLWDDNVVVIPSARKEARDSSFYWSAQSIDACGRRAVNFNQFDYHKNMVIDIDFVECDSTMNLSWNGYYYFQDQSQVEYTIERLLGVNANGQLIGPDEVMAGFVDEAIEVGTTTDTTFSVKVDQERLLYAYRVVARPTGTNGIEAISGWDTARAVWGAVPAYNYLSNVNITPEGAIQLDLYRDTLIDIAGMRLYRGDNPTDLAPIRRIDGDPDTSHVTIIDNAVKINAQPYYYNILIENECGNPIDTSNAGNSIHLTVNADNEALTNVLSWNEYQGWDSAVAFYNIYRGVDGVPAVELLTTVPASGEDVQVYVDDVYDNIYDVGKYCYRIEAVQGPVNPAYAGAVEQGISNSNEVCVVQDPLFYVPNAFSPNGVNKYFGPSGQFFDFTLFEMMIYNRWGELVYESRDINKGWDGTVNGEDAPLGSYVYTIRFVDANGNEHRRKGTVTLIK